MPPPPGKNIFWLTCCRGAYIGTNHVILYECIMDMSLGRLGKKALRVQND